MQIIINTDKNKTKKALATIHNHPSGNGPSPTDALALARQTKKFNINTLYICTLDNRIFALTVTNRTAAENFYNTNQDSLAIVMMNEMCKEYSQEQRNYDGKKYDAQISSLYALSTLLNTVGAGIQVMEGVAINGQIEFNLRKGERSTMDGKRIIKRTKCF